MSNVNDTVSERTNKPLVVRCQYKAYHQVLSFNSARNCSYDELRAKIKESFELTARPFKIRWEDQDGEKNEIKDEVTLDEAIKYYHSGDESLVTVSAHIFPEYRRPSVPDVSAQALAGIREDPFEESHGLFSRGEHEERRNPHDDPYLQTDLGREWLESRKPDRLLLAGLETHSESIGSSFTLNTDRSFASSDAGLPVRGVPPERYGRSKLCVDSRSPEFGPARDSEYDAPVSESQSHNNTGISNENGVPQQVTCCSECDRILDQIKYICTTCGEKTPTSRDTIFAAETVVGNSRSQQTSPVSTSPTRTVTGRIPSSSGSSSTTDTGYELCASCFQKVGVDHASMSVVNVSYFRKLPPTARELGIARRSAPKKEGQLRHAFLEKFWDSSRGWQDLVQDENPRTCSICESDLSGKRYKCGVCIDFTLCRACFSDVHNRHPSDAFLEMKANPVLPKHPAAQNNVDNIDEPRQ